MVKHAVILGCNSIGLAVAQALARHRFDLLGIRMSEAGPARFSRLLSQWRQAPSLHEQPTALRDFLLALPSRWDGALLYPTSDASVIFLARHRRALRARFHCSVPDWPQLKTLFDKIQLSHLARSIGLAVPDFHVPGEDGNSAAGMAQMTWPRLLKPGINVQFQWRLGRKVWLLRSAAELRTALSRVHELGIPAMICELIPGADSTFFQHRCYRDGTGRIQGEVCVQKLRQHPPGFGVGRVSRTVPLIPEIQAATRHLLQAANYRGVCSAEFKLDRRDKRFKLIECNLRPTLMEGLLLRAGVNFPWAAFVDRVLQQEPPAMPYRHDVYWIDLCTDLLDSWSWRHCEGLSWREFLRPYRQSQRSFALSLRSDPLPALAATWFQLRSYFNNTAPPAPSEVLHG